MNYLTLLILLTLVGLVGRYSIFNSDLSEVKKKVVNGLYTGSFLTIVVYTTYIFHN